MDTSILATVASKSFSISTANCYQPKITTLERPSLGGDSRPTSIPLLPTIWTLNHAHLNAKACKHTTLYLMKIKLKY